MASRYSSIEDVRAAFAGSGEHEIDEDALTVAHVAIEDVLVELRDARISTIGPANGFVIHERDRAGDGRFIMRLGTREGLRVAIKAYLQAMDTKEDS